MVIFPHTTKHRNITTIHDVRSWWSNFYWTSIFLVFTNWEKKWIKDWSNNCMLYKTLAKLLYKLRCEDYFTQVKPHQSMNPTHAVAQTWHPTLQGSYLQTHCCRVSSERINLVYNATKSVCLTQLIHPRKLWNIELLWEKKPALKMV